MRIHGLTIELHNADERSVLGIGRPNAGNPVCQFARLGLQCVLCVQFSFAQQMFGAGHVRLGGRAPAMRWRPENCYGVVPIGVGRITPIMADA